MADWINAPEDAFDEWSVFHGYSQKSILTYKSVFNAYLRFINEMEVPINKVSQAVVNKFIESSERKRKTKLTYLWFLSDIYDNLYDAHLIDNNPARECLNNFKKSHRGRNAQRVVKALSEHQSDQLLNYLKNLKNGYLNNRNRCAIYLMLGCGLRVQEVCDLNAFDVHLQQEQAWLMVVGKNDKQRVVPIPDSIVGFLQDFKEMRVNKSPYFLPAKTGRPYSPSGVYRMVVRAMQAAGIESEHQNPHTLRHTFATTQLRNGLSLSTVKQWLGHKYISTTAVYEHVTVSKNKNKPII